MARAAITVDLSEFRRSLRALEGRMRSTVLRKAGRAMLKPVQSAMKALVPVSSRAEYKPTGHLKKSIGNKVKLYQGRRRSFAGVHGADRVVVIVGPRSDWSRMVQEKFRFIKGRKGIGRFKSTRPQKVQPARTTGIVEKRTKFTQRSVMRSRQAAQQAAAGVLRAAIRGR